MFEQCRTEDWGLTDYEVAWKRQLALVHARAAGEIGDTLVLCEHDPVYTFGRSMKGEVPSGLPFPAYAIERGGKATYHGPGQLVIYPIVKLPGPNIVRFMRDFESWIIKLLASFGIDGSQKAGETGVWIENRKIASIGIAVKHWVTYHGAALNVSTNLEHFRGIEPCGYAPDVMTSLSRELNREVSVEEVKARILARNPFDIIEAIVSKK